MRVCVLNDHESQNRKPDPSPIFTAYLDPEAVDVGASDPADNHGEPPPPQPLPNAGAYAAYLPRSLGGSGRCRLNGIQWGCGFIAHLEGNGTIVPVPELAFTTRTFVRKWYGFNPRLPANPFDDFVGSDVTSIDNAPIRGEWVTTSWYWQAQNTLPLPSNLRDRVSDVLNNPKTDCAEFIKKLLGAAAKYGKAFSDNALDLFDRVQREADFKLKRLESDHGGEAGFEGSKRVVYIQPRSSSDDSRVLEHTKYGYAVTVVNELMHQARKSGLYDDRTLGRSIFTLLSPEEQAKNPLPRTDDVEVNSKYFHSLFKLHCRSVTGE